MVNVESASGWMRDFVSPGSQLDGGVRRVRPKPVLVVELEQEKRTHARIRVGRCGTPFYGYPPVGGPRGQTNIIPERPGADRARNP